MDNSTKLQIMIASHKPCMISKSNVYQYVFAGKADYSGVVPEDFRCDNEGDNISYLNKYYSELTVLYWAWKNVDCEYIGLSHYRRIWGNKKGVYKYETFEPYLNDNTVIVPKKRNYVISTLRSHYINTHVGAEKHLEILREVIEEVSPEYLPSFDKAMSSTSGYMFNMMIMPKALLDNYCGWLFPILEKVFGRVGTEFENVFDGRYVGRLSEFLFNCWLLYNKDVKVKEMPYIQTEGESDAKKVFHYLRAVLTGKKYDRSV